jgi:hypothetical protein
MFVIFLRTAYGFMRQGERQVPVLMLITFNFYVFYALPQFSQSGINLMTGYYAPSSRAVSLASWAALAGEMAFVAGWWFITKSRWRRSNLFDQLLPTPQGSWQVAAIAYSLPSLLIYGLTLLRMGFIPDEVRYLLNSLFNAYLAAIILLYLGYKHKKKAALRAGWAAIFLMSAIGTIQGMLEPILAPFVVGALAAWVWGNTLKVRWFVALFLAFLIINPAKYRFRELTWADKDVSSLTKVEQRVGAWVQALTDNWLSAGGQTTETNIQSSAQRTSDLLSLALVVDTVPDQIPYNKGRGMGLSMIFWIPRIFWPSKPISSDLLHNRYAVLFGYTNEEGTRSTTIGAYPCTEGYWNLGLYGVILFLGLSGMLLGLLFGNNGLKAAASLIATMAYLAPAPLQIPVALTLEIPSVVTFTMGIALAMWGLAGLVALSKAK